MPETLPELQPLLAAAGTSLSEAGLPLREMRRTADAGVVSAGALVRPPSTSVRASDLRSPGGVPVRFYRPEGASVDGPVHVHLHGGGWWMGSLETADAMCRELAASTGLVVASVDYVLAPEQPWPAAPNQCLEVVQWLAQTAPSLTLGGESAGANLAAVVALQLNGVLSALWLDVPPLDLTLPETESMSAFGRGHALDRDDVRLIVDWYVGGNDLTHPFVSPAYAELTGLPPTLVTVAELDPLRDQGLAFAAALHQAGVPVTTRVSEGHLHGTTWLTALTPSAADWHAQAVAFLCAAHAVGAVA